MRAEEQLLEGGAAEVGAPVAEVGAPVAAFDTPALLIDAAALEANLATLAGLSAGRPQRVRPHAKTHKSPIVAGLQRQGGAVGVCCAKLGEAEALAAGGVRDVLITTPIAGRRKLDRLTRLARTATVTTVADDEAAVGALASAAAAAGCGVGVVIEVDVGQRRCGVPPGPAAARLADVVARRRHLRFAGLQGYQGRLQGIVGYAGRRAAVAEALELLQDSAEQVRRAGHDVAVLTGGGTGSLAIDLELGGLGELQPGSYVFMDASYAAIEWDAAGNPPPFRPALSVLAAVVSRPAPDRAVVDVGWKSASSDAGPPVPKDPELVFEFAGDEHGIVRRRDGAPLHLAIADTLELIPSHCDTTVNLHACYQVVRDGVLEAVWPIAARGRST